MERISICLATYQGETYILQQLDSLRNQTMTIDEVIIFDDASKDKTQAVIRNYIEKYDLPWKFYVQESNAGYIKNFASAMQKSTGDYIFLCDQDDIWENNKIECIINIFQARPDINCINTSFIYVNEQNEILQQAHENTNYDMLWNSIESHACEPITFEEIIYHNISMGCTMAFRSSISDIYLAHSNFIAPHDWELNRIAAMNNGLYFYQEKLIRYRIHENNTVGNDNVNGKSNEKRIKNALTMLTYSKSYEAYSDLLSVEQKQQCVHIYELCENRYTLLHENKKKKWFSLLKHIATYHKIVSYKGMLADVLNK